MGAGFRVSHQHGESELINDLGRSTRSLPKAMVLGELGGSPIGVGPSTGSRGVQSARERRYCALSNLCNQRMESKAWIKRSQLRATLWIVVFVSDDIAPAR